MKIEGCCWNYILFTYCVCINLLSSLSCTTFSIFSVYSVGKSTLLTMLTGTHSEAASYEFTTLTCIPGIIHYNDTKIQLLDLPGIIEGASEGKGRGRQVVFWSVIIECFNRNFCSWLDCSGLVEITINLIKSSSHFSISGDCCFKVIRHCADGSWCFKSKCKF